MVVIMNYHPNLPYLDARIRNKSGIIPYDSIELISQKQLQEFFRYRDLPKGVCRAMYDFESKHQHELSYKVGDIIILIEKIENEEWVEGGLENNVGYFLSSFVQKDFKIEKGVKFAQVLYDFHAESPSEINLVKGTLIKILNDENNEWWEGTFEDNSGFFPASYVKIEEKYLHMNPKQKASVTYDYYADSENEITIKKGDIVYLHESDPDQEWWEANLNGNRGFIPKHYISVVKPVPKTSSLDRVKRSGEITSPEEEVEVAQEEDYKGSKSKKKKKNFKTY